MSGQLRGRGGGHRGQSKKDKQRDDAKQLSLSKREEAEVAALRKRIAEMLPASGSMENDFREFSNLPLCKYTLNGLEKSKFASMTQIQKAAIPHALGGRDILGAAKTGSGKTLAFIIPMLDLLYRERFSAGDGVGAVVISPTRELAMQIFEVLRTVGQNHFSLSAGLITGGKDFEEEKQSIGRMSILVATPGRLLQHLEQSPDMDVSNLRMLVLDEADRLLDMGFSDTLNSILAYMPTSPQRQTLLFSATQTKSVRDLARLSLQSPEYIAVHEKAETATPSRLTQHYVLTKAQDKLNLLYSFLRTHLQNKSIIFVSSCKEARFIFEAFRRLRPGLPLQCLHGKMKQTRRMLVYYDFLKKPSAALFATDIAARGLDFTGVDWVLQLDCPEDAATYIHRVGRTARFTAKGHALAVFTHSEAKGMLPALAASKIPIAEIRINPNNAISVTGKLSAEVAADLTLKELAQRAFASYLRSVTLQRDKTIFNPADIDLDALAESYGLATTPEVKIVRYLSASSTSASAQQKDVSIQDASKLTPEQAEALRKDAHARKNSNKSLAKLKAKIAAEKAAKRAAASSDGEESDEESREDDDGLGSSSDDSSDEESDEEPPQRSSKAKPSASRKSASSKKMAVGVAQEEEKEESEEEDRVLVRRAEPSAAVKKVLAAEDGLHIDQELLDSLEPRERARMLSIVRDTRAMAKDAETGGRGSDGFTPFQRIAALKAAEAGTAPGRSKAGSGKVAIKAAAAARTSKLKSLLASRSEVDKEAERARVKEKHRQEKKAAKGEVEDHGEDDDDGEGVRLGGVDDEAEDEEEEEGSESSPSSSDSAASSSSRSDDDEEEDAQPSKARGAARLMVQSGGGASKRGRPEGAMERPVEGKKKAPTDTSAAVPDSVEDMEALALQLIAKKARKA